MRLKLHIYIFQSNRSPENTYKDQVCTFTYLEQVLYAGLLYIDLHIVFDTVECQIFLKKAESIIFSDNVVS